MINKRIILMLCCLIVFSCTTKVNEIKEYHQNGNLKAIHYKNEAFLDSSIYFAKGKEVVVSKKYYVTDSIKEYFFYQNGEIKSKGAIDKKDNRIGKWHFYDQKGNLESIKEFINIRGSEFLNQYWKINKGDTLYNQSKYVEFLFNKDTILLSEPLRAAGNLRSGLFGPESKFYILLTKGYESKFDEKFINESKVELDTFMSLEFDRLNNKKFFNDNFNQSFVVPFGKWFKSKGDKVLRGIAIEHNRLKINDKDSILNKISRTYFEKKVYVLDSLPHSR